MKPIPYRVVRSARKTVAVYILPEGEVEVRAPRRASNAVIDAFVRSRCDWIETHLAAVKERAAARGQYAAEEGQRLLFLGKEYTVSLKEGKDVTFCGETVFLPSEETLRKAALLSFYRKEAECRLPILVRTLSEATGLSLKKLSVGGAASRWGSCSGKDAIRLSWRLILLPEEIIRYVVVHELCHTLEHNHSVRFWQRVEHYLPDYSRLRGELRRLEREYFAEMDWLKGSKTRG